VVEASKWFSPLVQKEDQMRSEGMFMPWLPSLSLLSNNKSVSIIDDETMKVTIVMIECSKTISKTLQEASTRVNELVEASFIGLSV